MNTTIDNSAQHRALEQFPNQIQYVLDNYKPHGLSVSQFTNVIIGGLGGSGIGGRLIKTYVAGKFPLPIECISDYTLPAYANKNTLLILASYSGNTEETLAMYANGREKGCHMLIVASGGKILELAQADGVHYNLIQGGFQPRMALGYSLTVQVKIFSELLGENPDESLKAVIEKTSDKTDYLETAENIFEAIQKQLDKKIIIVTDAQFEAVGIRFAQQIQENAKSEAFVHVLPEANHNVIETYYGQVPSVFIFIHSQENERTENRFDFLNSLLEVEYHKVVHVAVVDFHLASIYETIFRLDWLSLLIADHKMVDSLNVPNIASLKEFLEHC